MNDEPAFRPARCSKWLRVLTGFEAAKQSAPVGRQADLSIKLEPALGGGAGERCIQALGPSAATGRSGPGAVGYSFPPIHAARQARNAVELLT